MVKRLGQNCAGVLHAPATHAFDAFAVYPRKPGRQHQKAAAASAPGRNPQLTVPAKSCVFLHDRDTGPGFPAVRRSEL